VWSRDASCALRQWSSLPWVDREPTEVEVRQMRWVCQRCPCALACRDAVAADLEAGLVVAGFRAGESARARTYRLNGRHSVQGLAPSTKK
jgi:hypothetical protein